MKDILLDAIIDSAKILPFLFITYLIMEYIEHKMSEKSKTTIKKAGKWGPLLGSSVGIIPQCGFSASATNIPIFISEKVQVLTLVKIFAIKFIIGIIFGFIIDLILRLKNKEKQEEKIEEICEHEHCHCEKNGILKSAIKHTISILIYIFVITLIINCIVEWVGEDNIATFVGNHAILGPAISSLIGLIPNCAASVILTNLYIQKIISGASLIAGLLTGAGVGLIILFRTNKKIKENIAIVGLLYVIGVLSGIVLQLIGIV